MLPGMDRRLFLSLMSAVPLAPQVAEPGQPERTIRAGESFYEPPGAQHLVSASAIADRPARVLAIVIAESGHPITEPL